MSALLDAQKQILTKTVFENPYIKLDYDNPRQLFFLSLLTLEVMYGGAAGGGKSVALLAAALQFIRTPGYHALLIRRSFQDLIQPGCLIPMSQEWLGNTDAHWTSSEHQWDFPSSGAKLKFGYLESEDDKYNYRSSEYSFIGIDEATTVRESGYRYLFSRLRAPKEVGVPLRFRAASNPGGVSHDFIKQRFLVEGRANARVFIPASLKDNPHLDPLEYTRSLDQLDPITRRQLLNGDWSARSAGTLFRREWFNQVIPVAPSKVRNWVRFWDLAATEVKPGENPDFTAGVKIGMADGIIYIADVKRGQIKPRVIETWIKQTALADGRNVRIRMEEEKGSAGKNLVDHYQRHILPGWDFAGTKPTGEVHVLAGPLASAAEAGNVVLVKGEWITRFLDEIENFPEGEKDDQVKAACLGLQEVVTRGSGFKMWIPKEPQKALPAF